MNISTSNAVKLSNREYWLLREAAALRNIPGVRELLTAEPGQRTILERKFPDALFALNIVSSPFVADRELGAIQMDAYSAILNGENLPDIRRRYDRQIAQHLQRHNWD